MLISRRVEFSASHVCRLAGLSEQENEQRYGKEANPDGHGHNFVAEVTLRGRPDPVTGMVFDLKRLKELLQREIVEPFDHRFLNREAPPFDRIVPTPENIAREIWRRLAPHFDGAVRLEAVRLWETEDLCVEYRGEEER